MNSHCLEKSMEHITSNNEVKLGAILNITDQSIFSIIALQTFNLLLVHTHQATTEISKQINKN